jgi:hypothetical protein
MSAEFVSERAQQIATELQWPPDSICLPPRWDQKTQCWYVRTCVSDCPNKGEAHGHNTLYLQFNPRTQKVKLRCHSPHSYNGVLCSKANLGRWAFSPPEPTLQEIWQRVAGILGSRPCRYDWEQLARDQLAQAERGELFYECDTDIPGYSEHVDTTDRRSIYRLYLY